MVNAKRAGVYILAFTLPILLLCATCAISGIYPFGATSFLAEDLLYQYIDYFAWFKRVLAGQESIFFTTSLSLGTNTWGLYSYYLASPFNLLLLVYDADHLTLCVFTIVALKLGSICCAFVWYLQKRFNASPLMAIAVALGVSFSLCIVTNLRNPMWLDTLILLPFMMMGARRVVTNGKIGMLTTATTISLIVCWYTCYMSIIYVTAFTFVEWWVAREEGNAQKLSRVALRYATSMVLVLLLSAWTFIPTVLAQSGAWFGADKGEIGIFAGGLFDFVKGMLPFSYQLDYTPQIYCGIVMWALVVLFIVKCKRERIAGLLLLSFVFAGIIIYPVQYAWCGFRPPHGFYSRVAMFAGPTLVWMAGCVLRVSANSALSQKHTRLASSPLAKTALIVFVCLDLVANAVYDTPQLYWASQAEQDSYAKASREATYPEFSRFDKTEMRSNAAFNEAIASDYMSIQSYGSANNANAIRFLHALGYGTEDWMWVNYYPLETDELLGINGSLGYVVPSTAATATLNSADSATNRQTFIDAMGSANNTVTFTQFDSFGISGTITVTEEEASQGSYIMISVPKDSGWTVIVNGQTVETVGAFNNALTLIPTTTAGQYSVEMTYLSPGFAAGLAIALATAFILALRSLRLARNERR